MTKAKRILFGNPSKNKNKLLDAKTPPTPSAQNPYKKPDRFAKLAKKSPTPYRSRAAFKLIEINHKYQILNDKKRILDLGAAPGAWMQVARQQNKTANILGLDIKPIETIPNTQTILCDCTQNLPKLAECITRALDGKPDCILCDMAPNTIGQTRIDNIRAFRLLQIACEIAETLLQIQGDFLVKMRHAKDEDIVLKKAKANFQTIRLVKPQASRKNANEIYLLARGFSPPPPYRE